MDPIVGRKNPGSPDLSHALEEYKRTGDPQGLVDALRDEAQVKRLEAGIDEAQSENTTALPRFQSTVKAGESSQSKRK